MGSVFKLANLCKFSIDINECERDTHECHDNATCTNTIGDYNCTCNVGFSGDGFECEGEVVLLFIF